MDDVVPAKRQAEMAEERKRQEEEEKIRIEAEMEENAMNQSQ